MSRARLALGAAGEDAACAFLEARGYRIVERNARAGGVEIDVVAARGGLLAIVEVKTRRGLRHGAAVEAVDARKQARLARGAAAWLRERRARPRRVRFDVIACTPAPDGGFAVEHWEAAFEASAGDRA